MGGAICTAIGGAICSAIGGAICSAMDGAICSAMDGAICSAMGGAICSAIGGATMQMIVTHMFIHTSTFSTTFLTVWYHPARISCTLPLSSPFYTSLMFICTRSSLSCDNNNTF